MKKKQREYKPRNYTIVGAKPEEDTGPDYNKYWFIKK